MHGAESMGIVAATGCNTVYSSTYPYNPYVTPWTNSLFENAPTYDMDEDFRWTPDYGRQVDKYYNAPTYW